MRAFGAQDSGVASGSTYLFLGENGNERIDPATLDTALLFFDRLIVGLSHDQLIASVGEERFQAYHGRGLLKTFALSTEFDDGFDFKPYLFRKNTLNKAQSYAAYCIVENLGQVYIRDLSSRLFSLFRDRRSSGRIRLGQFTYDPLELLDGVGTIYMRRELASYMLGTSLVVGPYYGVFARMRPAPAIAHPDPHATNWQLFREWTRSTSIGLRELSPDAVLDFRTKYGHMGTFIGDLLQQARIGAASGLRDTFVSEIDRRVCLAQRVKGRSHERRGLYLAGLLNTLGGVLGGVAGAAIGGVVGTAVTDLALEYDRDVAPQVLFLLESVVGTSRNHRDEA